MRLLLDTHVLLWWLTGNRRLKAAEREAVSESELVHVSAATIWEVAIKASLGRIELEETDLLRGLDGNGFLELPIHWRHAMAAGQLPHHHADPFDRMLIAQAQMEQLLLVSYDEAFRGYEVRLIPANPESSG